LAVGFRIDFLWYQVGHGDFLHSFFSTISYHLEPKGWGSRYPYLMKHLYQGKLSWKDVPKAIEEVKNIRTELEKVAPDKVVWDIEDLCDILPRIILGCVQLSTVLWFSDTMPKMVRHGHRPCHPATTPLHGRYLERSFEDVQRSVNICLRLPAAGTGVHSPMFAVRTQNLSASVAGS
jgi:hypothetical protein